MVFRNTIRLYLTENILSCIKRPSNDIQIAQRKV
jgi:hypothetical protein